MDFKNSIVSFLENVSGAIYKSLVFLFVTSSFTLVTCCFVKVEFRTFAIE